jgi:hypothetical protein
LSKLRQRTKKYNKDYEAELEDFKKNPDNYPEEKAASVHASESEESQKSESEEESSSDEEEEKKPPRKAVIIIICLKICLKV